eukprot:TRINITY_DN2339_c2_g2_i2.p1 TRINITY_DN2339_c2_g2~~TRINITY_DN2339_c2_g2_i2.p1  ORF type:complete len:159 (-),score=36.32 TRINITY_DN2339_c2_g2_i2:538-1014(-)
MYEELGPKGLEILAFPCNQFGKQEPGTDEEILEFATSKYGATFQLFSKVKVNGDEAHEIFKWLKNEKGSMLGKGLKWNFVSGCKKRNETNLWIFFFPLFLFKFRIFFSLSLTVLSLLVLVQQCKFVLDKKGNVVDRFLPAKDLSPVSKLVEELLEKED